MPSYLVTGANRGLGVALVKNLASKSSNKVIGVVRDKKAAEERLAVEGVTNVHLVVADKIGDAQLEHAAKEAKAILGGEGLDVLIQNVAYMSYWSGLKSLKNL